MAEKMPNLTTHSPPVPARGPAPAQAPAKSLPPPAAEEFDAEKATRGPVIPYPVSEGMPPEKTAAAMLDHLKATGTGADKVALCDAFLFDRKRATAAELLAHLQRSKVGSGTLGKAGRWLHGEAWEPDAATPLTETEAMAKLKVENGRLRAEVKALEADKLRYMAESEHARQQVLSAVKSDALVRIAGSESKPESLITPRG